MMSASRWVALVGNPNCGKTALFNQLTGSRQKIANYAGVTVERKEGPLAGAAGVSVLDLPGAYSLNPRSPDEQVTCDVLLGRLADVPRPDLVVCVVDATQLARNLRLVLAVQRLGLPVLVALNMVDLAQKRGIRIDTAALSRELGVPVIATVAIKSGGVEALRTHLAQPPLWPVASDPAPRSDDPPLHLVVEALLDRLGLKRSAVDEGSARLDHLLLHPVIGPVLLTVLMFLIFQAVFAWAEAPMGWIETATGALGAGIGAAMPDSLLKSLLVDGIIAGLGGVVVFLPQIIILFFFILVLEESGYLPRAAFLIDRLMGGVGLSGRSFIPLLSSFACAIPGIMATRSIQNPRDRWVTIMIAPLMTCSARLPVYALLIGAFIPRREVGAGFELQGLVLFALYVAGILGAVAVAWVFKHLSASRQVRQLMMELPSYHWPSLRNVAIGLWQRVLIFLRRVGGIILALTVLLWFLASFPAAPPGASGAPIEYSLAGMMGRALENIFAPIGFNWQISVALIPGLAAREVAVSALGTVYALSAVGDDTAAALTPLIVAGWSLPTALALLAWYVFAPQCLATLATVRRETAGWRAPLLMAGYLFGLAYVASFITYRTALLFT